jgi:hypothetical protein
MAGILFPYHLIRHRHTSYQGSMDITCRCEFNEFKQYWLIQKLSSSLERTVHTAKASVTRFLRVSQKFQSKRIIDLANSRQMSAKYKKCCGTKRWPELHALQTWILPKVHVSMIAGEPRGMIALKLLQPQDLWKRFKTGNKAIQWAATEVTHSTVAVTHMVSITAK